MAAKNVVAPANLHAADFELNVAESKIRVLSGLRGTATSSTGTDKTYVATWLRALPSTIPDGYVVTVKFLTANNLLTASDTTLDGKRILQNGMFATSQGRLAPRQIRKNDVLTLAWSSADDAWILQNSVELAANFAKQTVRHFGGRRALAWSAASIGIWWGGNIVVSTADAVDGASTAQLTIPFPASGTVVKFWGTAGTSTITTSGNSIVLPIPKTDGNALYWDPGDHAGADAQLWIVQAADLLTTAAPLPPDFIHLLSIDGAGNVKWFDGMFQRNDGRAPSATNSVNYCGSYIYGEGTYNAFEPQVQNSRTQVEFREPPGNFRASTTNAVLFPMSMQILFRDMMPGTFATTGVEDALFTVGTAPIAAAQTVEIAGGANSTIAAAAALSVGTGGSTLAQTFLSVPLAANESLYLVPDQSPAVSAFNIGTHRLITTSSAAYVHPTWKLLCQRIGSTAACVWADDFVSGPHTNWAQLTFPIAGFQNFTAGTPAARWRVEYTRPKSNGSPALAGDLIMEGQITKSAATATPVGVFTLRTGSIGVNGALRLASVGGAADSSVLRSLPVVVSAAATALTRVTLTSSATGIDATCDSGSAAATNVGVTWVFDGFRVPVYN